MARYITRAHHYLYVEPLWNGEPNRSQPTVDNHEPTFTGLLDSKGDEIWRAPNPMGFGHDKDW